MSPDLPDPKVQILLLEDVPADVELVRQALHKARIPAEIRLVDRKDEYVRALESLEPDVVLADHALPHFRNSEALTLARERYPDIPFIFVSGAVGEELAVEAVKEGATDYVLKDHLLRLGPAVRRALDQAAQRREKSRAEETLRLVLANSLDAVAMMDSRGIVTGWNLQAERLFGWRTPEALGRPLADLIIPERLRAAHWKGLERYLAVGEGPILGRRVEMTALHRDGYEFPVELSVTAILQEGGASFSAFIRDLSSSRRQAARLDVEHAVAKILAEATCAEKVMRDILAALGRGLDWDLAYYWRVDQDLIFAETWHREGSSFAAFTDVSRNTRFAWGKGLPGRAWEAGHAVWAAEVAGEDLLPRLAQAKGQQLEGALAFPIRDGDAVVGIIEAHTRRPAPRDPDLLEALGAIGSQIGQFLKRMKGEEAIRATEQQLRLITDALPSLIAYVDREWRYVFANQTYEAWFGRPPSEFLGKTISDVLGEEVFQTIRPFGERALRGERVKYEALMPFRGGSRWMESSYVPDTASDGSVKGFFVMASDITARRKADESLAFLAEATAILASSLDYETTLANIARLAVPRVSDCCTIVVRENGVVRILLSSHNDPEKARLMQDILRRFPPDPELPYGFPKVLRTGEPDLIPEVTEEMLTASAQDAEHLELLRRLNCCSAVTVPMVVGGKTIAAMVLLSGESGRRFDKEDLQVAEELARRAALAMENARLYQAARRESDERRQALEAVRDLNDHLEQRVLERTAKLEEITRELDAFASTVAHDLRAPLRVMKGFSEMLIEDYSGRVLDSEGQEYARKIDRASDRMSGLVDDLLSYSRLAREDVPTESVDLEDAVGGVLRDMADEIRQSKAEVAVEKPLPRVIGHGGLLAQLLRNLLSNAMKFVPPGASPKIRIRSKPDGAGWVRLWIEDNGIGIAPDHIERIFGVFERLHTQDRYPGTGLGLAIVRRAIERMGGTVGVESEPGKGSRFWIRLPKSTESGAA